MALFGRSRRPEQGIGPLPVTEFWRWWHGEGRDMATTALADGEPLRFVAPLAERVAAINPHLEWETGPGRSAQHELTLTGAGDPALRRWTERWVRAAPPADAVWQYSPARQPEANFSTVELKIEGARIAHDETTITMDERGTRIDVVVHHPALATLPEPRRGTAVYLLLDALLGEDQVERWIGKVDWRTDSDGADPIERLRDATEDLMSRRPAEEEWTLARGTSPAGEQITVRTQRWLRWIDRPLFDLHSRITLAYRDRGDGYPTDAEFERVHAAEDEIFAQTSSIAEVATVTTGRGRREFDIYSDSEDQNASHRLQLLAARLGATITQSPDPRWSRARVLD